MKHFFETEIFRIFNRLLKTKECKKVYTNRLKDENKNKLKL